MSTAPRQEAQPSRFGRHMLDHWLLDPAIAYLNHGTVGAPPRRVLELQQRLRDEIERQPSRFMLRELSGTAAVGLASEAPRIRTAAARVADFLGVDADGLVFVDNVTTGVNAVLRSLEFEAGQEIVITDLAYGAVRKTAEFVAARRGVELRTVHVPLPVASPESVVQAISAAVGPRTRVAIVDHIASDSSLVLPVADIATACRERGAPVLVDGAHAPGAIALDVGALGVDWYVGNLHKWALAPRSSGILWAAPAAREGLHPAVISWGLGEGYVAEFDLVGTRDPTPHLSAPYGLDLLEEWGLADVIRSNHELVWRGAELLGEAIGAEPVGPRAMFGPMVTVRLPESLGRLPEDAARLRDSLLFDDGIEVHVGSVSGRLTLRIATQVYNDEEDLGRLVRALEKRANQ